MPLTHSLAVRWELRQSLRIEVFDRCEIALPNIVVRQPMGEITALSLSVGMAMSNEAPLLPAVRRAVFLPRERPLLAFKREATTERLPIGRI